MLALMSSILWYFVDIHILRLLQTCGLSHQLKFLLKVTQFIRLENITWDELGYPLQSAKDRSSVYDDADDEWDCFYAVLKECLNKFLRRLATLWKSKRPTPCLMIKSCRK